MKKSESERTDIIPNSLGYFLALGDLTQLLLPQVFTTFRSLLPTLQRFPTAPRCSFPTHTANLSFLVSLRSAVRIRCRRSRRTARPCLQPRFKTRPAKVGSPSSHFRRVPKIGGVNLFALYSPENALLGASSADLSAATEFTPVISIFSAVPAPGAVALLGLAGVFGARRRRN